MANINSVTYTIYNFVSTLHIIAIIKMDKNIAFIYSSAYGHLINTPLVAKFYIEQGYQVQYFVAGKNDIFFKQYPFAYKTLKTKSFGINAEKFDDSIPPKRLNWFSEFKNRLSGKHYHNRKQEIEQIITDFNPKIIFLDEFCVTDFIILFPFLKQRKCIVLTGYLPSIPNDKVPPINSNASPKENIKKIWQKYLRTKRQEQFFDCIKFLNRHNVGIVMKRFKEQKISQEYKPSFTWENIPFFKNLEKWYMAPHEFDFIVQTLPMGQKYMGSKVDLNRKELFDAHYHLFLKLVHNHKNSKIIYCSLGTVSQHVVKESKVTLNFFKNIIHIAEDNPNWFFLIKTDSRISDQLKLSSLNCMTVNFAPQLDILKKSDAFITHSGGNSSLEAIYQGVPMLAIPISDKWNYNGQASRIEYHGLGIRAKLTSSRNELQTAIKVLLDNKVYKDNILRMKEIFLNKYGENYIETLELPLID